MGLFGIFFTTIATLFAQSEGPNNSTNIFDGDGGQINDVWANQNLARVQDDLFASLNTTTKNKRTNYLQAQNFGFSIPAGSTVDGIVVEIERYASVTGAGSVADDRIRIIDATGTIVAGSEKSTGLVWPVVDADAYQLYGGIADTWSVTDWTPAKINNNNFGVAYQGKTSNDNETFDLFVDHIRITVHYTVGGSQRYSVATGAWSNALTWATSSGGTPGASVPTSSDDVFIEGTFTVTQDVNGAFCNSLTIGTATAGTLTFDNNNRDIDIGDGGVVIAANGDIISAFDPRLTTTGDLSLNAVLTNNVFELRMETTNGLVISGTGSLGFLNIRSTVTNTGTITITSEFAGSGDELLTNGASGTIIFSGGTMSREIDLTTVGNTMEFAQTSAGAGDFNIAKSGTDFYNLVISGDANKRYGNDIIVNGDLTIAATGILNNSNRNSINLSGNWTNNNGVAGFVPDTGNGSVVVFEGGNTQTVNNSAGAENFWRVEVNKTASTMVDGTADITIDNQLTMTEGILNTDGNSLDGGGNLIFDGGEIQIGTLSTTVPEMTGTYTINAGTFNFDGTGAQTIRSTTSTPVIVAYNNLIFSGSGTKTLSGPIDVDGDLTISGTATLDVDNTNNYGITLAGNWSNSGTFDEQNGTVIFNGANAATIVNTIGETFYNLTINTTAANALTLNDDVTVDNTITFTDGHIVTTSTELLTLGASSTVASVSDASYIQGPVAKISASTSQFDFPVGDNDVYLPVGMKPSSTSSTTFVGQYIRSEQSQGAAIGAGIDHIGTLDHWTLERTSGTADADVLLNWNWPTDSEIDVLSELLVAQWDGAQWVDRGNNGTTGTVNTGSVESGPADVTSLTSTTKYFVLASSTSNNPLSINRYFVGANGDDWDDPNVWAYSSGGAGGAPTPTANKNVFIEAGTLVDIDDSSTPSISVLSLEVSGTLNLIESVGANIVIDVGIGGFTLGSGGNITGSDDDDIELSGDIILNNLAAIGHTALEVNFDTQNNTISGTGSLPFLHITQNGQVNTGSVTFVELDVDNTMTNNGTIEVTDDIRGGSTLTNGATGTFIYSGNNAGGNVVDATTVGNTLRIINTSGSDMDYLDLIAPNDCHHLIIDGTDNVEFGFNTSVVGNLTIQAGAVLVANNRKLNIGGNWTNNNGAGGFLQGTNDITFDGTSAQTISISSGNEVFEDLIIDNTSSTGVTISMGEVHVDNSLTLTDGIIFTDATNFIVIEDNATSDEGSSASFVDGPIKKVGNDPFICPVGDNGSWARLEIENLSNFGTTTEFTCQYLAQAYSDVTTFGSNISQVSSIEHWLLSRVLDVGNDASCDVRLYWENATRSSIVDLADLRVGHFTGGQWENFGGTGTDNGGGTGEIVGTTTFTSFSPITFASEFGFSPLPVELLTFTAESLNNSIVLLWSTATEVNNDYFEVQRSENGEQFKSVGTVKGAGNSSKELNYEFTDLQPIDNLSYYRLKQVDFDGDYKYSDVISVSHNGGQIRLLSLSIFPNPTFASDINFKITAPDPNENIDIQILDLSGRSYYSQSTPTSFDDTYHLDLSSVISSGLYLLVIRQGYHISSRRLLFE